MAEVIQSTGDVGARWILDLCGGIVEQGCSPEDRKSGMVLPIYRERGIWWGVGRAEEMSCWNVL